MRWPTKPRRRGRSPGLRVWIVQILSTVKVHGAECALDYCNTYLDRKVAMDEAMRESKNPNVLTVQVHGWYLLPNGQLRHAHDWEPDSIIYSFRNDNHPEYADMKNSVE